MIATVVVACVAASWIVLEAEHRARGLRRPRMERRAASRRGGAVR